MLRRIYFLLRWIVLFVLLGVFYFPVLISISIYCLGIYIFIGKGASEKFEELFNVYDYWLDLMFKDL
jgi:hypothetical protein